MTVFYGVNCGFTWFLFLTAVAGYYLTLRRMHEHWPSWIALAVGWGIIAITNTLLVLDFPVETSVPIVTISSFVMVLASQALLLLKFVAMRERK